MSNDVLENWMNKTGLQPSAVILELISLPLWRVKISITIYYHIFFYVTPSWPTSLFKQGLKPRKSNLNLTFAIVLKVKNYTSDAFLFPTLPHYTQCPCCSAKYSVTKDVARMNGSFEAKTKSYLSPLTPFDYPIKNRSKAKERLK